MNALQSTPQRLAVLKKMYFKMGRAEELDERLQAVVSDFDAGRLTGDRFEGCGLVVVGESGSGKSREIDHAVQRFLKAGPELDCGLEKRVHQVALEGPTSWKSLGQLLLDALGYPISSGRTEPEIWARVRAQLKGQGIWLLHIDECQHIFDRVGEHETKRLINAIKGLMKHREWPIAVILSGIPTLIDTLNIDAQLRTKLKPFRLPIIDHLGSDLDEIDTVLCAYGDALSVDVTPIRDEDAYFRLVHGFEYQFGRVFRFLIDVVVEASQNKKRLTLEQLADRYEFETGCNTSNNVFIRPDYEACNVKALFASD